MHLSQETFLWLSWSFTGYHSDYPWQYPANSGFLGLYWAILDCLGLSLAIWDCLWLSLLMSGNLWLSLAISGYIGLSWAISGYHLLYLAIMGYNRLSWDISYYHGLSPTVSVFQAFWGYIGFPLAILAIWLSGYWICQVSLRISAYVGLSIAILGY